MYYNKEKRLIMYGGDITPAFAEEFLEAFFELDQTVGYITLICYGSEGGEYELAGMAIRDAVRNSKNNVIAYGYGIQASSQALILIAADEVYLASPDTCFLLHCGNMEVNMDLREATKTANIVEKQNEFDYQFLQDNSSRPASYFKEEMQKGDFYVFAEKALELGLINGIKGYTL